MLTFPLLRPIFELGRLETVFRVAALRVTTDGRLSAGLREGAAVVADTRLTTAFEGAAREIDAGRPLRECLEDASVPAFVQARWTSLGGGAQGITTQLTDLADGCARRQLRLARRALRWGTPIALLALGVLVALHFLVVFDVWYSVLSEQAMRGTGS